MSLPTLQPAVFIQTTIGSTINASSLVHQDSGTAEDTFEKEGVNQDKTGFQEYPAMKARRKLIGRWMNI
jgi:hypothetical protein